MASSMTQLMRYLACHSLLRVRAAGSVSGCTWQMSGRHATPVLSVVTYHILQTASRLTLMLTISGCGQRLVRHNMGSITPLVAMLISAVYVELVDNTTVQHRINVMVVDYHSFIHLPVVRLFLLSAFMRSCNHG